MFRRRFVFTTVTLCAVPLLLTGRAAQTQTAAPKEKANPVDAAYDACMAKTSTTPGMITCAETARAAWDKQMNRDYQALLKAAKPTTQTKLRAAQRAWLAFRDKEGTAQNAFYDRQGTMWLTTRAIAEMRTTKDRAEQLAGYISDNQPN